MSVCTRCPEPTDAACADCQSAFDIPEPVVYCVYCGSEVTSPPAEAPLHDYDGDFCHSCNSEFNDGFMFVVDSVSVNVLA